MRFVPCGPADLLVRFLLAYFWLMNEDFMACLDVLQGLIDAGVPAGVAVDALTAFVTQDDFIPDGVTGFRLADAGDFGAEIWSFGGYRFAVDFDSGV